MTNMLRRVWVGGTLGATPTVVATTMMKAMLDTVSVHRVPGSGAEIGYPEQWSCGFIDGEPMQFRCTTTIIEPSGDTYQLYVEQYDLTTTEEPLSWMERRGGESK